jgi:hypothetical protein
MHQPSTDEKAGGRVQGLSTLQMLAFWFQPCSTLRGNQVFPTY